MPDNQPREELITYERLLTSWLPAHEGQYVVIRGSEAQQFFDSYATALDWAYGKFGLEKFFVKRISADQDIVHFNRDV